MTFYQKNCNLAKKTYMTKKISEAELYALLSKKENILFFKTDEILPSLRDKKLWTLTIIKDGEIIGEIDTKNCRVMAQEKELSIPYDILINIRDKNKRQTITLRSTTPTLNTGIIIKGYR